MAALDSGHWNRGDWRCGRSAAWRRRWHWHWRRWRNGARAQTSWPEQPIRILVGFTPGVAPDITGRLLAEKFTEAWGKPAVVENVTGAGGNIATERVARAAPDGYTLLMGGNASLVFSPSMYDRLGY